MMAVFGDGDSAGTIGGGAVEFEAQKQAALMFNSKQSHIASYTLAKSDVADLGMICGGDVTMLALCYKGISESELFIEATLENTDTVIEFVCERLGDCPQKIRHQIEIAVEEIFTNIARYAYHPSSGSATVRVFADDADDIVTIEFEDSGVAYDPLSKDDPDVSPAAGKRTAGGLGVFMVKNIMDSVEYRREGNKNVLRIQKRLN